MDSKDGGATVTFAAVSDAGMPASEGKAAKQPRVKLGKYKVGQLLGRWRALGLFGVGHHTMPRARRALIARGPNGADAGGVAVWWCLADVRVCSAKPHGCTHTTCRKIQKGRFRTSM